MAITKLDFSSESVGVSATPVYTAPTVITSEVLYCIAHNYDSTARTLTINIVDSGGTVSSTNQYVKTEIQPNETKYLPIVGRMIYTGAAIYASSSAASAINLNVGIKEETV